MRTIDFEAMRLDALYNLDILDSDPEPGFDAITQTASDVFATPISAISLIDSERQWFKSTVGIDVCETPRSDSVCDIALRRGHVVVINDATTDPCFCDHPAVLGEGNIRFYAGAPVRFNGVAIGMLCIADRVARPSFTEADQARLETLANLVSNMFAMRKDGLVKKDIIRASNETQKKLEMMEAAAGVGYWRVDLITEEVQWSRGVYKILGLSPETYKPLLSQTGERYHPDDWPRVQEAINEAIASGTPFEIEARIFRTDGEWRFIHTEGTVEYDETGTPDAVFGIFQDITEHKAVEHTLRAATRAAEDYAAAQSDFLSNMSHEIRTPLTAVIGFSNLLAEVQDLPDDARRYADRVRKGSKTLLSLVNDILDYSKLEAGQVRLDPRPTDILFVTRDVCDQFTTQAEAKGLTLDLAFCGECPQHVYLDEVRLIQVLNNLIGNACKFTSSGGVTVALSARAISEGYDLRVEVRDTGIGIAPEKQAKLFQRFSQADRSIHREHGGTGLGLAICQEVVRLMGGRIGVESVEGEGSVFWFEVPVVEVPSADVPPHEAYQSAIEGRQVLLVEDHAIMRDMLCRMIEEAGAVVTAATGGIEAISRCGAMRFDAILMDIHMPEIDGVTTTQTVRKSCPLNQMTPVIALTADGGFDPGSLGLFNDVVKKPVDYQAFMQALSIACS